MHHFQRQSFQEWTHCDTCGKVLWGSSTSREGMICEACEYVCHAGVCQDKAPECQGSEADQERSESEAQGKAHPETQQGVTQDATLRHRKVGSSASDPQGLSLVIDSQDIQSTQQRVQSLLSAQKRQSLRDIQDWNARRQSSDDLPPAYAAQDPNGRQANPPPPFLPTVKSILINTVCDMDDPRVVEPLLHPRPPPSLNLVLTSDNFARFIIRIGIVFWFKDEVEKILRWEEWYRTVIVLLAWCLCCLYPLSFLIIPQIFLINIIVRNHFKQRRRSSSENGRRSPKSPKDPKQGSQSQAHSIPTQSTEATNNPSGSFSGFGNPLMMAMFSKTDTSSPEIIANITHIQNSMGDFAAAYDYMVQNVAPYFGLPNAAQEETASQAEKATPAILLVLIATAIGTLFVTHYLVAWNYIALWGGVGLIMAGSPFAKRFFIELRELWDKSGTDYIRQGMVVLQQKTARCFT